ncbi:MAG: hypothetical protein Ct9H300mP1_39380 [Planctomycetaceae bacterium]|nr:MAG: hypothetical protein Ct9H300mP1_39380 [Planctomycetaceae bacterium]
MTRIPCDADGRIDPETVISALTPDTVLVSVMWANNEVGTINPVIDCAQACHDRGVIFHTDAVRRPVVCRSIAATWPWTALLSAHKIYGPKGIGALIVRRGTRGIRGPPQIEGGGHEAHLRSGTLPVPLVIGFGTACRLAREALESESNRLSGRARDPGRGEFGRGCRVCESTATRPIVSGQVHLGFEGVDGDALLAGLRRIAVSSGSACTTANPKPSHVGRQWVFPKLSAVPAPVRTRTVQHRGGHRGSG